MIKKSGVMTLGLILTVLACSSNKSSNPVPTIPTGPTHLTGVGLTETSIRLTWTDNSNNEDGFAIFKAGQTGNFNQIVTTSANTTTYTDTQTVHGTIYRYYVAAVNGMGNSGPSDTVSLHPYNQAPASPSVPVPSDRFAGVPVTGQFFPTWQCSDAEGDSISYAVYYGTTNPPPFMARIDTTTFDGGARQMSTTYYWKIVAYDKTDSAVGPVWSFRTEDAQIAFDDGVVMNAFYWFDYFNISANKFAPSAWPVTIDSVMIRLYTLGDTYWPWPDPYPDPILVTIFLDDGTGMPRADSAFSVQVTGQLGQWVRVNIPDIVVSSGNFWVGESNVQGGGEEALCLDGATDHQDNKWSRIDGVWGLEYTFAGDQMIRAKVYGDGVSGQWIGGNDRPPERPSSDTKGKATSVLMQNK